MTWRPTVGPDLRSTGVMTIVVHWSSSSPVVVMVRWWWWCRAATKDTDDSRRIDGQWWSFPDDPSFFLRPDDDTHRRRRHRPREAPIAWYTGRTIVRRWRTGPHIVVAVSATLVGNDDVVVAIRLTIDSVNRCRPVVVSAGSCGGGTARTDPEQRSFAPEYVC